MKARLVISQDRPATPQELLKRFMRANPKATEAQARVFFVNAVERNKDLSDKVAIGVFNDFMAANPGYQPTEGGNIAEDVLSWLRKQNRKTSKRTGKRR